MNLTILFGDEVSQIEVSEDIELENFLALCQVELSALSSVEADRIKLTFNGRSIVPAEGNMKKQIRELGVGSGDAIQFEILASKVSQLPGSSTGSSSSQSVVSTASASQQPPQSMEEMRKMLVASLVKGIKVPPKEDGDKAMARKMFDVLVKDPYRIDVLQVDAPDLAAAFEQKPNDFDHFYAAFCKHRKDMIRKEKLKHDPTSVEGQRYIAEMIERENIEFSQHFAMEHMPEAFIPVHMLFIRMKINGQPVVAFVDSGAQVSILSEQCAKRCNVLRLVDRRIRATAVGVGGTQKFIGRIHSCQVQIKENIFPCPFDVMADRNMDLLLGLNTLLRHKCCIDLQKMVLRFGDGTETEFLSEHECEREKQAVQEDIKNASQEQGQLGGGFN